MGHEFLDLDSYSRILGGKILREVSRSFYLTLRLLPYELRGVASLGYLLARASDTIADTPGIRLEARKHLMARFREMIQIAEEPVSDLDPLIEEIQFECLAGISHPGERRLLENLKPCMEWLTRVDADHRAALNKVLNEITQGQMDDLIAFDSATEKHLCFLATGRDLEAYADHVAGSVGVFWTEIAHKLDPDFALEPLEQMSARGLKYGRGLQLLNIIRDVGDDLRNGRCYFPKDELVAAGWEDGSWKSGQTALMNVSTQWMAQAEAWIREGAIYADRLTNRRLKLSSALPALIGASTLRILRKSQSAYLSKKVKIPRGGVRQIFSTAALRVFLNKPLEPYFDELLLG